MCVMSAYVIKNCKVLEKLIALILVSFQFAFSADYKLPSYDNEVITPATWQQVELKYLDVINGKEYPAEIRLLRPVDWLEENNMDQAGSMVNLSLEEFGIVNVNAEVMAIKPAALDISTVDWAKSKARPVIGTFKRYAEDVRTYTFKDEHGNIDKINATPNHPFYVRNKDDFIAIDDISVSDELVTNLGKEVRLVCPIGKNAGCGEQYNKDGKPVLVYNLEVYQQHIYYVGNGVLVHNACTGRNIAGEEIDSDVIADNVMDTASLTRLCIGMACAASNTVSTKFIRLKDKDQLSDLRKKWDQNLEKAEDLISYVDYVGFSMGANSVRLQSNYTMGENVQMATEFALWGNTVCSFLSSCIKVARAVVRYDGVGWKFGSKNYPEKGWLDSIDNKKITIGPELGGL